MNSLHKVIATVEPAGYLLAAEYDRPEGIRGSGDKVEIDVEIEMWLRSAIEKALPTPAKPSWITREFLLRRKGLSKRTWWPALFAVLPI